jgi:hypothetical protein
MLDPKTLPVTSNVDVVFRNDAAAQPIFDSWKGGDKTVLFWRCDKPYANFTVLVCSEHFWTVEGDGLDKTCIRDKIG